MGNSSSSNAPQHATFPAGFFGFTITGLTPGQDTTVILILHEKDQSLTSYYKYGPTVDIPSDHWYSFLSDGTTGAVITQQGSQTKVYLSFTDGQRGDDDLVANGEIVDLGTPTKFEHPTSSGGG